MKGRVGPSSSTSTPMGMLMSSTPRLCDAAISPSTLALACRSIAYSDVAILAMPTLVPIKLASTANASRKRWRCRKLDGSDSMASGCPV